jgi:hypothetical protein
MVVHTCNAVLRRPRQEDWEFETILSYTVRPYLKTQANISNDHFKIVKKNK